MLSRSQARAFFFGVTILSWVAFLALTVDSFRQVPAQTNADQLTDQVIEGKHLWDRLNCMGCHTLLGEGGYYAPELTKVYERRGPAFIEAILRDPEGMYPGQRRMVQYDLEDAEIAALIAFFEWIGKMDLNGFPPEPVLFGTAVTSGGPVATRSDRPQIFNQMCIACHAIAGQGGAIGPALDDIGSRMSRQELEQWLTKPSEVRPGTTMPDLPLGEADIRELSAYLTTLGGSEAAVPPEPAQPSGAPAPSEPTPDPPVEPPSGADAPSEPADPAGAPAAAEETVR